MPISLLLAHPDPSILIFRFSYGPVTAAEPWHSSAKKLTLCLPAYVNACSVEIEWLWSYQAKSHVIIHNVFPLPTVI